MQFLSDEPETLTFLAAYPYDVSQSIISATLQQVDLNGNVLKTIGYLTDDGDLSNADEIADDGVFSTAQTFSSDKEERIYLAN